jgi:hypothetical protein
MTEKMNEANYKKFEIGVEMCKEDLNEIRNNTNNMQNLWSDNLKVAKDNNVDLSKAMLESKEMIIELDGKMKG